MDFRYQVSYPLEHSRPAAVYAVTDRWESDSKKVLTLLDVPRVGEMPAELQAELSRAFERRHSIKHPLLPTVSDLATRGNRLGIISEFIEGTPFSSGLPAVTSQVQLDIAFELVQLLAFLHERAFVIGYLDPTKLFWNSDNQVKVNLLLAAQLFRECNHGGQRVRYWAPEYLLDREASREADVYSLGMNLYLLFTGMPPFSESDPGILAQKQMVAEPLRPQKLNTSIPSRLDRLIRSMTQKGRKERPSAGDVRTQLAEEVNKDAVLVAPLTSHLVGRQTETRQFRELLLRTQESPRVRFVTICGSSGIGKTALAQSFENAARIAGYRTFSLHHHPNMNACDPFRVLIEKLSLETSSDEESVGGIVEESEPEVRTVIKRLVDLVELISESGSLLIRATDLQWIDEGSFEAYRRLADLTGCHLLILADLRTDERQGYWEELSIELRETDQLTEIPVGPLTRDDELQLTRNLIGPIHSGEFLNELSRICQGVPFFVYEFLRNLQQNGELRYLKGAWTWEPDETDRRVPETVAENLNARLDHLNSEEQALLESLAVLDHAISVGVLARIREIPISEIITLVERLEKLDFVTLEGTLADPVTELKHAWLAQTIRERLSGENRMTHHLRIATCLESDYLKAPEPFMAETLTRHFLGGRSSTKTNQYIWPALSYLRAGRLFRHASNLIDKAVDLGLVSLSDWQTTWEYLELLYASGRLEDCRRVAERALEIWHCGERSARVHSLLGRIDVVRGEFRRATNSLEQALGMLEPASNSELEAEILCELLCCLSRTREEKSARSIADRLFQGLRERRFLPSEEKLYHALYFHLSENGLPWEALNWERRSLKASLINESPVRTAGRLFNLGATYLELGWWHFGSTLNRKCLHYSRQIGNAELEIYAQTNIAIELRKKGQHSEAVSVLEKALRLNRRLNKNPHLEIELNIELAKNAVYQLHLGKARTHLEHLSALIRPDEVFSSSADVQLLSGWLWILSGDAQKAEALAEKLRTRKIPREAGRHHLLSGQAKLAQHNFTGAMEDANLALQHFPHSAPYYRVRARLLQGEIALQDPSLAKAGPYIRDALRISKEHFYTPLLAKAYMLRAKWLAHTDQPIGARAHCLRALQVSATVERPMLQAEICSTLGAIEARTRSHEKAIKQLLRARDILRESGRLLPSDIQGAFLANYLEPIEQELSKHRTNRSQSSSHLLSSVTDFAQAVNNVENRGALAKTILRFISKEIPRTSVNLYFRSDEDRHFHLAGSIGKCRRTGRQLLQKGKGLREDIQPLSYDGVSALGLFLRSGGFTTGLLYTERTGQVSEAEFDYLKTLKFITDLLPRQGGNVQKPPTVMVSGLELKDGKTIVGKHRCMRQLFDEIRHLAKSRAIVLISGETGTGKELVAQAIHDYSSRRNGTYLPINCAAIQRDLIENELFGHGEGSYTGAGRSSKGVFEAASNGTLFLDEVSAMPLELQTRFLRVLETKRIRRLGEVKERVIDTRIVAATNQNLRELVRKGLFRSDLYHRLNVLQIEVPPLRSRLTDIPTLCSHFLANLNRREERNVHLTEEALSVLGSYQFPGNVRELKNIVASLYYMADNAITAEAIRSRLTDQKSAHAIDNDQIAEIMDELASGRANFWQVVWEPFLRRDLSRGDVRRIISLGLEYCGGSYRKLIDFFGIPQNEYKKFLASLSAHDCKVDFRPFRKKNQ